MVASDLELVARALNSRVRRQFEMAGTAAPLSAAEQQAARADASLPPLPHREDPVPGGLENVLGSAQERPGPYRIAVTDLAGTPAFDVVVRERQLWLLLNQGHPLYRDLYGPLASSESPADQAIAQKIALTLLAAARAEAGTWPPAQGGDGRRFRQTWADVLATFMNM